MAKYWAFWILKPIYRLWEIVSIIKAPYFYLQATDFWTVGPISRSKNIF